MTEKHRLRTLAEASSDYKYRTVGRNLKYKGRILATAKETEDLNAHAKVAHANHEHDERYAEKHETRHEQGGPQEIHHGVAYSRQGHKESSFHDVLHKHGFTKTEHKNGHAVFHKEGHVPVSVYDHKDAYHGIKTRASFGGHRAVDHPGELHRKLTDIKNAGKINEEAEINEGLKLIKTHENGAKTAKVYKDSEWGEHRVKFFTNGKHHKDADYHTDDEEDAHGTAKHWLKEEVELTEISNETMKSYITKAKPKALGYGFKPSNEKEGHKAFKRMQGIHRAENKIEDSTPVKNPKVHDLRHMKHDGEVYDHTQTHDEVKDGDVLHMHGNRSAIMYKAWPTMVHGESEHLHSFNKPGKHPVRYNESVKKAHDIVKGVKESVEFNLDEGKTYRASGNYKADNVTKALKKYSAKKKDNDKRKIAESENLDELFGLKKAIQHYKDGASPLPVNLRKEPTFEPAKPKHVEAARKVSNKPLPLDQRREPTVDVPKSPVKAPVKRAAASAPKAPSKTAAVKHVVDKAINGAKKPAAKSEKIKEPAAPPPEPVKPRVRVRAKISEGKTFKADPDSGTIIKNKKYVEALKKAHKQGRISAAAKKNYLDTTGGNNDEYTP